ncbi:MAG: ABC-F family ATP-binding cassette domain-containing protein [Myxococcaceae bacterium]
MVSVSNLSKHYGPRVLFEDVSFNLNPGERVGLVGANGSGKSTLMRVMTGEEERTSGTISLPKHTRIGFLKQDQYLNDQVPIIDCVMMGDRAVYDALQRHDHDMPPDAYTLESRSATILEGLGISNSVHSQPLSVLSGGFKLRVLLAQVLVSNPEVLLLDEPTNHLDILTIRWLEKFLMQYRGAILVISHDRRFLDRICTHILDIDYQTASLYTGNYGAFEVAKQLVADQKKAEISKLEGIIAHKQAFVDRFKATASKARQAQSRMKQIEKIEIPDWVDSTRRAPNFQFLQKRSSGREVLKIENICKSFGEKQVLKQVTADFRRADRIGIIGPNGVGKSTLLKILMSELQPDSGVFTWGHETQVGYFAQDHDSGLKKSPETAESWLWRACPDQALGFVKSYLGRVLFSGDDAKKPLKSLSGGELARLDLARHMIEKPNVLILDEPTNHLDIETIEALVAALKLYEGTLIFVSHDRWFVSELATRILEITPQGVQNFLGTFEEYLDKCGDDHLDAKGVSKEKKNKEPKVRVDNSEQKKLASRMAKVTMEIERLEAKQKEISERFCEPGFFERTPVQEQKALQEAQKTTAQELEKWFKDWEALER